MQPVVLKIESIPAEGQEFVFTDQEIWTAPWEEFKLGYTVLDPLEATLEVLPQEEGLLLRGKIRGAVGVPCDRCSEEARVDVGHVFDEYEPFPVEKEHTGKKRRGKEPEAADDEELEGPPLIQKGKSGLELDVSSLLWEQFLLSLPVKPLCDDACKGLCRTCGKNLNEGQCDCPEEEGDPRMAPLRNLKIS